MIKTIGSNMCLGILNKGGITLIPTINMKASIRKLDNSTELKMAYSTFGYSFINSGPGEIPKDTRGIREPQL